MDDKHMTIKIFDDKKSEDSYVLWSPVENKELHVVTSKGWVLQGEDSPPVLLEENKKYKVSKSVSYKIHKGSGDLILGVLAL
mgnify:CR=1 FL=1